MPECEMNMEYSLYKAVWLLYGFYEEKYRADGLSDNEADRLADETICDELNISVGQLADLYAWM